MSPTTPHDPGGERLTSLGPDLWVADGGTVSFYTMPYPTRMVVVRLADGSLWVHSPIALDDALQQQINQLGRVAWLIAPNHLHHLFIEQWQQSYPHASSLGTPEVIAKRRDLHFDAPLTGIAHRAWSQQLDQLLFTGSPAMTEAIFFHRQTRTLIVSDLIENLTADNLPALKRWLARVAGVVAPNGQMPLDWRLSFIGHRNEARQHLQHILAWQPEKLVMAHGEIVHDDAGTFLERAFRWLNASQPT